MKITRFLILCAVACVLLAIPVGAFYVFLLIADIYSDFLLVTLMCLFGGGFLFSVAAVISIFVTRTCWLGLVPLVFCLVITGTWIFVEVEFERAYRRREKALAHGDPGRYLKRLREAMFHYAENNDGYLPDANDWCDALMQDNPLLEKRHFQHPLCDPANAAYLEELQREQEEVIEHYDPNLAEWLTAHPPVSAPEGECHYAFNRNLSGAKLSDVSADCILLFEASGDWNLSGTQQVLNSRYSEHGYAIVLYTDGRRANYWFAQSGVRTFSKDGKAMFYIAPKWDP